ncbi:MAG: ribonuclease R [Gammaproteobacteria bacterium]|nr:ribonuclease R [Gammaproteobacteria bacterium]
MTKPTTKKDAFAAREAQKYHNPIASREFIMELLRDKGEPLTWQQLAELLGLDEPTNIEALVRRLSAMERDGQVIRNRRNGYGLMDKMDLVRGYVIAHPDGFGFLVPDDSSADLFLSARQMRMVFHRDRIVAHVSGIDRKGRREGAIVEILQRNTERVVGRFSQGFSQSLPQKKGIGFVAPDNKRVTHDILVPEEYQANAVEGQIVVVQLLEQPSRRRQPMGQIVEILGEHMAPGMEIDVAIRAHELPYEWPHEVTEAITAFSTEIDFNDAQQREDIRDLPLVTIDGADARDFDDAVYCESHVKGWRLIVAIADVSHYVKPESALDHAAVERGNSVYFPGRVIPMLPEVLSNGLCSINPEVDRLCMVCDMIVSGAGTIKSYRFYDAVMRSHARLIYDDVAKILDGDKALRHEYRELVPHLDNLKKLYGAFSRQRKTRGTIEFETTDTVIEFGPDKKIQSIVPLLRNDAHKLIEECMISANICAAKYLSKHKTPSLYRVHERPDSDKLTDLREFLSSLGLKLAGGDHPEAKHYAELLAQVSDRPDAHLIQTVMLRSLKQAVYTPENAGHFGLALAQYAHFTSPIRRYPDLLVHRAIRYVFSNEGASKNPKPFYYDANEMQKLGEQCSLTERRADEATRDVTAWLKCEYMMDKVGECFDGIISGVTSFGLFVELQHIYVEGLVHVTALSNDYYHFDPVKHCLVGERTQQTFRLADKINVKVVRVDLDEKRMDFELVSSYVEHRSGARKNSAKPKRKSAKRSGKKPLQPRKKMTKKAAAKTGEKQSTRKKKSKVSTKTNTKTSTKTGNKAKKTVTKSSSAPSLSKAVLAKVKKKASTKKLGKKKSSSKKTAAKKVKGKRASHNLKTNVVRKKLQRKKTKG